MNGISLASQLEVSTDIVSQDLDDELVMLDLGSETYFGLDEISTRAWRLIATKGTLGDVLEELEDEYEVEREQLWADLVTFTEQLQSKGLVKVK